MSREADDAGPRLVDVSVAMAREMLAEDERNPAGVLARRREAAARLLAEGWPPTEVESLFGADALTTP